MIALPRAMMMDRLGRAADMALLAVIVSLPWSTSATGILLAVWLVLILPQTDWRQVLDEARHRSCLPALLLIVLTALSGLWSDGSLQERFNGIAAVGKLAILPLLVLHVRQRTDVAPQALKAFLASAILLMILSWVCLLFSVQPSRVFPMLAPGVPVKDWISQTSFFLLAAFALAHLGVDAARERRWQKAAILTALALSFIVNLMFIQPSRTGLVAVPALMVLFAVQRSGMRRGIMIGLAAALAASLLLWQSSDTIRKRLESAVNEVQIYSASGEATSAGYRLEWYRQSLHLLARQPLIGYGSGGVRAAMEDMAQAGNIDRKFITSNPHNQLLSTALQTGTIGLALLIVMWAAHAAALGGQTLAARIGLGIVAQNLIGGLFNSHIYDFTQGWVYTLGVGVALAALAQSSRAEKA